MAAPGTAATIRTASGGNVPAALRAPVLTAVAGAPAGIFALPVGLSDRLIPLTPVAASPVATPAPSASPVETGTEAAITLPEPMAGSDEQARKPGDELFDLRRHSLPIEEAVSLKIVGFRFDEDTGRILSPGAGIPLTNAHVRANRNAFHGVRGRLTLLRLEHETSSGGSTARKNALIDLNRAVLPREVILARKISPEKERATILRRAASAARRWLGSPAIVDGGVVSPANAKEEERLGALFSAAAVKRLSEVAEGRRLLDELRGKDGNLRLPTMRVLRLDDNAGAVYSSYGRQLVFGRAYMKRFLLALLPPEKRAEAESYFSTDEGALKYLLQEPSRVTAIIEALDASLFHELVHFRQDLERPLQAGMTKEEILGPPPIEMEYEAFFRQSLYVHSRLSLPDADLSIERLDEYLRLIDSFDVWKAWIDDFYGTHFLNGSTTINELARLQHGSRRLLERLAGPVNRRSEAAAKRLAAAARGTDAIAVEMKAADALFYEYRKRWPSLAREGLSRWAQINESLGRLPLVMTVQLNRASHAESRSEAAVWREKAERTLERALTKLVNADNLSLDARIEWSNALAAHFNAHGEPWPKDLYLSTFRDYESKARELRAEADRTASESARRELHGRAEQFERTWRQNRVELRGRAEADLSTIFTETEPKRRRSALVRGFEAAEALGDAELSAAFKPLMRDASEAGWDREISGAAAKATVRLAARADIPLAARIKWISALTTHNGTRPWKKEIWIAILRDYPEQWRELRDQAEKSTEESARTELLRRAKDFDPDKYRAILRARAETNLAAARAERDPSRRASALEWGSMQAGVLGDAKLIGEFKANSGTPAGKL